MKAKVKKGHSLLFCEGVSNKWNNLKDIMIVNMLDKYIYKSFKQAKNHLLIDTENGLIDIVFTGNTPLLELEEYTKNQLVFKIKK